MSSKLMTIWKNRKEILEGIKNSVIRDEFVEDVAWHRSEICSTCEHQDVKGKKCMAPGTHPCCSLCGCSLKFKTRSLSSGCPDDRWFALLTEDEEDKLDTI